MKLTQKILKELLHYDPETGIFTWRERNVKYFAHCKNPEHQYNSWHTKYCGQDAGTKCKLGRKSKTFYIQIRITLNGKRNRYLAHRLAFLYMSGRFPSDQIDHIDGNGMNNSWNNLREVSSQDNQKNRSINSNNISGYIGVCWHKATQKWQVRTNVNGNSVYGGCFDNIEDAIAKRKSMEVKYGFHKNHGRKFNL